VSVREAEAITRHRPVWAVRVLVAVVLGAALEGAVLAGGAVGSLFGSHRAPVPAPAVGQSVRTSFGALEVQTVLTTPAGTPSALAADGTGGAAAPPGEVWVDVSAAVTNLTDAPRSYGADQFRLRLGRAGVALAAARTSGDAAALPPISSSERLLGFLVPESHPDLWLEFHDPGRGRPVLVDLGRVGDLPHLGTGPAHSH